MLKTHRRPLDLVDVFAADAALACQTIIGEARRLPHVLQALRQPLTDALDVVVSLLVGGVRHELSVSMGAQETLPALPRREGGQQSEQGAGNVGSATHPFAEAAETPPRPLHAPGGDDADRDHRER